MLICFTKTNDENTLNHKSIPKPGLTEDYKSSRPTKANIKKAFVENRGGQLRIYIYQKHNRPFLILLNFSKDDFCL